MRVDRRWKRLSTALISDVLDELGFREQVISPGLIPLEEETIMVGRARTGQWSRGDNPEGNSYLNLLDFMGRLGEGDVVVFAQDDIPICSLWGDLLSTAASSAGAVGAVIDGLIRDPIGIKQAGFPVFSRGSTPVDPGGRAYLSADEIPVTCGGVSVAPGALLFGDADGVVVIPEHIEEQLLALGITKCDQESLARTRLCNGEALAEVFRDLATL